MHNLAFTWQRPGTMPDVFSLLKTYINLLKKVLGLDHPHCQSLLSTLVGGKQQGTIS
jgi:hypothetical protein